MASLYLCISVSLYPPSTFPRRLSRDHNSGTEDVLVSSNLGATDSIVTEIPWHHSTYSGMYGAELRELYSNSTHMDMSQHEL
jgi:hypothetical protein